MEKIQRETRDEYKVFVNDTEVIFEEQAYKPDTNTGVVAEIAPVLAAIKNAGADFTYTYTTDGDIPSFSGVYGQTPYYSIYSNNDTVYRYNTWCVLRTVYEENDE